MVTTSTRSAATKLFLFVLLGWQSSAYAHLMVAQHGTLNFHNKNIYVVLSLPASAFIDTDSDGDGKLSPEEFNRHHEAMIRAVAENVILTHENQKISLEGIMLSPAESHHSPSATYDQIVVMGRFTLHHVSDQFRFHVGLYGTDPSEKILKITAIRSTHNLRNKFEVSPSAPESRLFSIQSAQ